MATSRGPRRIALLIDAENADAGRITSVIAELSRRGDVTVRRAYANWANPCVAPWVEAARGNAIRPVQAPPVNASKNAADISLVIDAMDLVHDGCLDTLAVVSSDADFTPLALRARESRVEVLGFGGAKAPEALRQACNEFFDVERLAQDGESRTQVSPSAALVPQPRNAKVLADPELHAVLRRAVLEAGAADGWSLLSTVGQCLNQLHKRHGFAQLKGLLVATELFVVEADRVRARRPA
jgi:uncharacterized protein (TIGR00288 family)